MTIDTIDTSETPITVCGRCHVWEVRDDLPCPECNGPIPVEHDADPEDWAPGARWSYDVAPWPLENVGGDITCPVCWSPPWCPCMADEGGLGSVSMVHRRRVERDVPEGWS